MKILLLLFILSSCGKIEDIIDHIHDPKDKDPRANTVSNMVFDKYVSEFEYYYEGKVVDIPINFSNLDEDIVGVCYTWTTGHREIEIDQEAWENLDEVRKYALIYHELGHCQLNRDHNDKKMKDGCKESLMNSFLLGEKCLIKHDSKYIDELFGGK